MPKPWWSFSSSTSKVSISGKFSSTVASDEDVGPPVEDKGGGLSKSGWMTGSDMDLAGGILSFSAFSAYHVQFIFQFGFWRSQIISPNGQSQYLRGPNLNIR